MGINLTTNFNPQAGLPLDNRMVFDTIALRNGLESLRRYEGLTAYVVETSTLYILSGGILDANWVEMATGGEVVPPIRASYADVATMIAAQSGQEANYIYLAGTQFYRYDGTTIGDITDYTKFTDDEKIPTSEKGTASGVATLDATGKIPSSQLPTSAMEYKGTWDATTNTPTLADGTGDSGDMYICSVAGTQDLGSGSIEFEVGDWVLYDGTTWERLESTSGTNLTLGTVTATTLDIDSSTGSNVTIPSATITDAGLLSATDKVKLNSVGQPIAIGYTSEANMIADQGNQKSGYIYKVGTAGDFKYFDYLGTTAGDISDYSSISDVYFADDLASFPAVGFADVMYVAEDTNKLYRWNGSAYVTVGGSEQVVFTVDASKPATGVTDVLYVITDTQEILVWNGSSYDQVAGTTVLPDGFVTNGVGDMVYGTDTTDLSVVDAVADMLKISQLPGSVSMTSPANDLRELGNPTTPANLVSNVVLGSTSAIDLQFVVNGSDFGSGYVPVAGSNSIAYGVAVNNTTTFSSRLTDGTGSYTASNRTIRFVYPYYWGVGAVALTPTEVRAFGSQVITEDTNRSEEFTTVNQVSYYAYPAAYGSLTSITDINGYEVLTDWTKRTEDITGLDGTAQSYNIYEFNNLTSTTMTYTFTQ